MTLSQFMHIETYPRQTSSLSTKRNNNTVEKIVREAIRDSRHCSHVKMPQSVKLLSGKPLEDLPERLAVLLNDKAQDFTDKHGFPNKRAVRFDAHVLLAAIYSYPEEIDQVEQDKMDDFFKDCLAFHQNKFGEIDSGVLHIDENYYHIHVYTIDSNAKRLHPGWVAKEHKKIDSAYKGSFRSEMSKLQDEFFKQVSSKHDISRFGPARKRLTRGLYLSLKGKAEKQVADYLEQLQKEIKDKEAEADKKQKALQIEIQRQTQEFQQKLLAIKEEYDCKKAELSELEMIKRENAFLKVELANSQALVVKYQQVEDDYGPR